MYYKACTITFQYYCVLQSLHNHVPVLLCTTKLAETHSSTRCCNFPHRRGDARGQAETEVLQLPHRHGDVCAAKRTRFCSFPHRHGINVAKNDAKKDAKRRADQLEANKADPQTINGNPLLRIREKTKKCSRICALENVSDSGSEYPPKKWSMHFLEDSKTFPRWF